VSSETASYSVLDRDEVPDDFPQRIRSLRASLGLTQERLAELTDVSFTTVNRWENGNSRPRLSAWRRIQELAVAHAEGQAPEARGPQAKGLDQEASTLEIDYGADPERVRLVAEAERLAYGHLFNPAFATETSLIDPLPHQRIAVYERMLREPRLRFLLADDAGAGKTIMAGLYIREMLARRLLRRVLVASPAGLVGNWFREMRTLFRLPFRIVSGADARTENPFASPEGDLAIVSIDTLASPRTFARLQELGTSEAGSLMPFDLVIFDEAHKLSASQDPSTFTLRRTDRYRVAEALAGLRTADARWRLPWSARHILLLTATPHMGKDFPYYCLWRLLEPEILSTEDAFRGLSDEQRAHYFIRRTKEEMVRFDGTRIYPERISDTLTFDLSQGELGEQRLYDETTAYIRTYYNRARILNRSAARLAMSVFQRRLASSTYALLRSLERRLVRIDDLAQALEQGTIDVASLRAAQERLDKDAHDPLDDQTADEEESVDGRELAEVAQDEALGGVVAQSLAELQAERERVDELIDLARKVYDAGGESKFEKLQEILRDPAYREEKILIFSEHRDTLDFLVRRLEGLGFTGQVARIHGGLDYRERDAQVEFFRRPVADGGARYLVATDAAGEGINLQFCWLMVNYDVPWNPARLEQRMGRIHRYGQKRDPVVILNLVAAKTREGRVLHTLLEKLEAIRKELRSDKVFDVVGRMFEGVSIKEYMEQALTEDGARDAVDRLSGKLTAEQVEALQERERSLYGSGGDVARVLPRLRSDLETESLRRLLPGFVRRFVEKAAPLLHLRIDGDPGGIFSLRPLRADAMDALAGALETYPADVRDRLTVYRPADPRAAIFVHPGEPLFEALRKSVADAFAREALRGAVFIDPTTKTPYLLHLIHIDVERTADATMPALRSAQTLESRLIALRQEDDGAVREYAVEHLLLLRGASHRPSAARPFVATARVAAARARAFAEESAGASLVEHHQTLLREQIGEREVSIRRGYDHQAAELAEARLRFADRAKQGDRNASRELEAVKARQRALSEERELALAALRREPELVKVAGIQFLSHVLVMPSASSEDQKRYDAEVEQIAVAVAVAFEREQGGVVQDVSNPERARSAGLSDWPGFDLLSTRPDGSRRCIEVKGRADVGDVEVSENEWAKACTLRREYWLYAVFSCASATPRLMRVPDPFAELLVRAKGGVKIDYREIASAATAEGA